LSGLLFLILHFDGCKVASHKNFAFPWWLMMFIEQFFMCLFAVPISSLLNYPNLLAVFLKNGLFMSPILNSLLFTI
jgi:hypothetical protein